MTEDFIQKRPRTAKVIAWLILATLLIGVAGTVWREVSDGHIRRLAICAMISSIGAYRAGRHAYRYAKDVQAKRASDSL